MKINADIVLELRKNRCWSQEELALATGLNLRTVQRIENEAIASLQSKKALASALEVDVDDLDHTEQPSMKKYEFKTLDIDAKSKLLASLRKEKPRDMESILNEQGKEGWMLVQLMNSPNSGNLLAFFQREYHD